MDLARQFRSGPSAIAALAAVAGLGWLMGHVPTSVAADAASPAPPHPGAALYAARCASCHEGGVAKAPHKMFLQMMAPDAIHTAMVSGVMQPQSVGLDASQKTALAEYLAGAKLGTVRPEDAVKRCEGPALSFDMTAPPDKLGWGVSRDNHRYIPANVGGITAANVPRLKLKWAFAYPGAQRARSQPTVAMGAVFVGSQSGAVYALDRETGCARWTFRASTEVRTPVIIEPWEAGKPPATPPLAYFGDLMARVYAIDATTGELKWVVKVDDHPNATVTGAPVLYRDRLYVPVSSLEVSTAADPNYACCTFRGSLVALDARTGEQQWKSYSILEEPKVVGKTRVGTPILAPSGAPIWNSPTLDPERGMIYVGTGENYSSPANDTSDALLAFRMSDGRLEWSRQKTSGDAWNVACMLKDNPNCPVENGPDVDFGAGTVLARRPDGKVLLLAGQKSGDVYALDVLRRGEPVWHNKVGRGGIQGGVHFGMALEDNRLYVPISDMTQPEAETHLHNVPSKAGMYAIDIDSGKLLWSTPADNACNGRQFCDAGISAAITAIPGAVLAGHMDGRLRAYDGATGKVLWQFDSTQKFTTVNGYEASGGSFGGGTGPIAHDGMLFANSGYGLYFHMPGNVLLAFAVE